MGLSIEGLVLIATLFVLAFLLGRVGERPLPHHLSISPSAPANTLAVILSGAGGWIAFDKRLAESLVAAGLDTIGIDSLRYFFRKKRSATRLADDLSHTIRQFLRRRTDQNIVLIGYSQGADVLPLAVNLFEQDLKRKIKLIVLIGVAPKADFRLRLIDLITGHYGPDSLEVKPAIEKLGGIPMLLIYGHHDRTTLARDVGGPLIESREIPGGHICRRPGIVAELILSRIQRGL